MRTPAPRSTAVAAPVAWSEPGSPSTEELPDRRPLGGILHRSRWLIAACTLCVLGLVVVITHFLRPVFEATTSIRIDDKQPNVPEIFKAIAPEKRVLTEMEELRSRGLIEDATDSLALQVRVVSPRISRRADIVDSIQASRTAPAARYIVYRVLGDSVLIVSAANRSRVTQGPDSQRIRLPGVSFVLGRGAARVERFTLEVKPFELAVRDVSDELKVLQPTPEANIVTIRYRDTDPDLVWRLPSLVAFGFVARRQQVMKSQTRSTVEFLRGQLDTIAIQLKGAENSLRVYRERHRVINPEAEGNSQVNRLVTMQSERGAVDAERGALARLVTEVEASAQHKRPGDPSPYRRLLAFPTLLRSQAASELLQALATAEEQHTALLARRTPQDADVQAIEGRIGELESQLRSVAQTYLQGLTNQVASMDGEMQKFNQQLAEIPQRELDVARLEREPRVLDEMYTLIQTRWKEAQIAESANDPSVRVVDPAIPPLEPVRPKPLLNMLGGLFAGLLLGTAGAMARDTMDRAVRTRRDVRRATGLPVLGFIPTIPSRSRPIRLIMEKSKALLPVLERTAIASEPLQPVNRRRYTFLDDLTAGEPSPTVASPQGDHSLGSVPALPVSALRLTLTTPGRPAAEAYGSLYTNIAFARSGLEIKTLVVTSPLSGDGKTTCSVNLALTLAHRGLRVILIDADLRRGSIHSAFEAPPFPGLADYLQGTVRLEQVRRIVYVGANRTLDYVPIGRAIQSPSGLLDSEAMVTLLGELREQYDRILIDSPPVGIVTDAAVLGIKADGIVLVARAGVTDAAALSHAMDQLMHVGAPVLGVVLNDIDFRRDRAYDSLYKYYNHNDYLSVAADSA